jgi:hypothetical protein
LLTNGRAERATDRMARSETLGLGRGSERDGARTDQSFAGVLISEVEGERVSWLWRGWLALGKISVMDGDPGLGKSAAVLDLAQGYPRAAPSRTARSVGAGSGKWWSSPVKTHAGLLNGPVGANFPRPAPWSRRWIGVVLPRASSIASAAPSCISGKTCA